MATVIAPRARAGATEASQFTRPVTRSVDGATTSTTNLPILREGIVCLHDLLHQLVTNDVLFVEVDERNPLHVADHLQGFHQAGDSSCREIDLRDVAGDD